MFYDGTAVQEAGLQIGDIGPVIFRLKTLAGLSTRVHHQEQEADLLLDVVGHPKLTMKVQIIIGGKGEEARLILSDSR